MKPEEIRNLSFSNLLGELLQYLEDISYTQLTLDNYRRTLKKIEPYMIEHGIDTYKPEVGRRYCEDYLKENELGTSRRKAMLTAIRRLNDFYSGIEYTIQQECKEELMEKGGYVRLLDVGGKIKYQEILDEKTKKMVPTLKFSNQDQIAMDYRKIQETFGTEFYYAYSKQEDFKRFFNDMGLVKKA